MLGWVPPTCQIKKPRGDTTCGSLTRVVRPQRARAGAHKASREEDEGKKSEQKFTHTLGRPMTITLERVRYTLLA